MESIQLLVIIFIKKTSNNVTNLHIKTQDVIIFKEKIGFSHCCHKAMRLEAGCSYLRLRNEVWKQQKWLVNRVRILKKNMTIKNATILAINELKKEFPIYNEYYTNPTKSQMIELLRPRRKRIKPMFCYKYFPTVPEYLKSIEANKLFANRAPLGREAAKPPKVGRSAASYAVSKDKKILPCFYKKVINIKSIGKKHVYDLEVTKSHSFVANGIVVHNCIHDPKVIRKNELTKFIDTESAKIKKMRENRNKCVNKYRKKQMMTKIKEAVDELKPYKSERAEINKTISKYRMCVKRKYRFLKKPKGVIPTILQNLLDARKKTRKVDMAACKEEIKRLENMDPSDLNISKLINEQKSLLDVLNKRQLAYKVSANSMYVILGTRRGYLPFMPGACCTTFKGRENITKVAKEITTKYKGKLVYGD